METRNIITEIPTAQETYKDMVAAWADLDTTDLLLACSKFINESKGTGKPSVTIAGISDIRLAEKVAMQLGERGYHTVVGNGPVETRDGVLTQTYHLWICWILMPLNRRDDPTV